MPSECNFFALVVVYNMRCSESSTCGALDAMKDDNLHVLIYDNSTLDYGNRAYCAQRGWTYLGGTGNAGISKAYNACINHLTEAGKRGLLCFFDDDTQLDISYFMLLREAAENGGHIFVPLIESAGRLLSPCLINSNHRTRFFPDEETALTYAGDSITAINSGMAVDLSLYESYRYDEHIFLDGVDHTFLLDMKDRGERVTVFAYRCRHSFSGDERPPKESALIRFRIYAKDYQYILRDRKIAYLMLVGKRALRLSLQYRSMDFLKNF